MPAYIAPRLVLLHKGTKGMKWGYNDGKRNGGRTAKASVDDIIPTAKTAFDKNIETINRNEKVSEELRRDILDGSDAIVAKMQEADHPLAETAAAGASFIKKVDYFMHTPFVQMYEDLKEKR